MPDAPPTPDAGPAMGSADALPQYRSLSGKAVASFVLGVLSIGAMATPVLLVVPMAAVAMATLAIAEVRRSEGVIAGEALAKSGLFLAVAFVAAVAVRDRVREHLVLKQADQAAQTWFHLLTAGEIQEAVEMLGIDGLRQVVAPPEDRSERNSVEDQLAMAIKTLGEDRVATWARSLGSSARLVNGSEEHKVLFEGRVTRIERTYRVVDAADENQQQLQLLLSRSFGYRGVLDQWRIQGWRLVK